MKLVFVVYDLVRPPVKAVNNAGRESTGFSNGILVDTTAPNPPLAVDYGDYSLVNNVLQVYVIASDAESGIDRYKLSLGTMEEPGSVFNDREIMTDGGAENLTFSSLSLSDGEIYFFTVSAINNASSISLDATSDGIMVDADLKENWVPS